MQYSGLHFFLNVSSVCDDFSQATSLPRSVHLHACPLVIEEPIKFRGGNCRLSRDLAVVKVRCCHGWRGWRVTTKPVNGREWGRILDMPDHLLSWIPTLLSAFSPQISTCLSIFSLKFISNVSADFRVVYFIFLSIFIFTCLSLNFSYITQKLFI